MKALRPRPVSRPRSSSSGRPSPPGGTRPTCRSNASATPASGRVFLELFAREGRRGRGERGGHVPVGRACPAAVHPSRGRWSCSSAASSSRPGRSSGPRARGTSGWRWSPTLEDCAARGGDPRERPVRTRGACVSVDAHADLAARVEASFDAEDWESTPRGRGRHRSARPRRGPRRRADGRGVGRERVGEEGRPALLPGPWDGDDRVRSVRVPRQAPVEARVR